MIRESEASEFESLPDALSDEPATELEHQLLADAGCNLDNLPPWRHGATVRALRAGHEAGRVSVLQAPVRVWREGDPPPEHKVALLDQDGWIGAWDPTEDHKSDWPHFIASGPVAELLMDFPIALAKAALDKLVKDK